MNSVCVSAVNLSSLLSFYLLVFIFYSDQCVYFDLISVFYWLTLFRLGAAAHLHHLKRHSFSSALLLTLSWIMKHSRWSSVSFSFRNRNSSEFDGVFKISPVFPVRRWSQVSLCKSQRVGLFFSQFSCRMTSYHPNSWSERPGWFPECGASFKSAGSLSAPK